MAMEAGIQLKTADQSAAVWMNESLNHHDMHQWKKRNKKNTCSGSLAGPAAKLIIFLEAISMKTQVPNVWERFLALNEQCGSYRVWKQEEISSSVVDIYR